MILINKESAGVRLTCRHEIGRCTNGISISDDEGREVKTDCILPV